MAVEVWAGATSGKHSQDWEGHITWCVLMPQNHRMVRVGRDLCGSSSPTPCRSRVTQGRLHRTLSSWVLNFISREEDSTTSLASKHRQLPEFPICFTGTIFQTSLPCHKLPAALSISEGLASAQCSEAAAAAADSQSCWGGYFASLCGFALGRRHALQL